MSPAVESLCPPPRCTSPQAKSAAPHLKRNERGRQRAQRTGRMQQQTSMSAAIEVSYPPPAVMYIRTPGPNRSGQGPNFRNSSGSLQTTSGPRPHFRNSSGSLQARAGARSLYSAQCASTLPRTARANCPAGASVSSTAPCPATAPLSSTPTCPIPVPPMRTGAVDEEGTGHHDAVSRPARRLALLAGHRADRRPGTGGGDRPRHRLVRRRAAGRHRRGAARAPPRVDHGHRQRRAIPPGSARRPRPIA